jgi:hypothetical protein
MAEPVRDAISRKNGSSDEMADNSEKRPTTKLAWDEPITKPKRPPRPTILYVPLPMFLAWEGLSRPAKNVVRCRKTLILVESLGNCRIL